MLLTSTARSTRSATSAGSAGPPAAARAPRLVTVPGVYRPQHDSRILMRAICEEAVGPGTDLLDLGTGSGVLALCAARLGARVTAVDVSRRAVLCARVNSALAGHRMTVRRHDLSPPGRAFDVVVSNPPYVPAPGGPPPRHGAARAWDAGHDGRAVLDRVCATAPKVLRPRGVLLMVHSGMCGAQTTLRQLGDAGLAARVVARERVPLGPVLHSRRAWLSGRGLLHDDEDTEELVVIRAQRP